MSSTFNIIILISLSGIVSKALSNPTAQTQNNCSSQNEIVEAKVEKPERKPGPDFGDALFLTPLLRSGRIKEAKELARVRNLTDIPSYSGFLTVDEKLNSSLFFWFFPAAYDAENAPLILWLQGGPGLTTFFGIFLEHGPFRVDEHRTLKLREYPWTLTHSVLYIDSPVGTGFSFTGSNESYSKYVSDASENLYEGLVQFFQLMPEYRSNPFFLAGQSYAGKYVPSLMMKIHEENGKKEGGQRMNLQGFAVGSGFFDPLVQSDYGEYFYNLGLADEGERDIFNGEHKTLGERIQEADWEGAYNVLQNLIIGWPGPGLTHFKNITGLDFKSNYLETRLGPRDLHYFDKFMDLPHVRRALHVGTQPIGNSTAVFLAMRLDIPQSVKPLVERVLNLGYRVLIYSTQLDVIVPHVGLRSFVQSLNWTGSDDFRARRQEAWRVNGDVAGYVKSVNNLTYLFMRSAGHSAPIERPEWCFRMITDFTKGIDFNSEGDGANVIEESNIRTRQSRDLYA